MAVQDDLQSVWYEFVRDVTARGFRIVPARLLDEMVWKLPREQAQVLSLMLDRWSTISGGMPLSEIVATLTDPANPRTAGVPLDETTVHVIVRTLQVRGYIQSVGHLEGADDDPVWRILYDWYR